MKKESFDKLLKTMSKCDKCTNFKCKEKSLINIYNDYNFSSNIPSIWTDWFNRLDSKIMIIGQDWGPYNDMKKLNNLLKEDKSNWNEFSESDIFITNAIMCARQGDNYRGNNIDLKKSTLKCSDFLLKQIEIVKPKVILTLGYYPLLSLSNLLNFDIERTLKETIRKYPEINKDDYVIIPLYHPVAQIKKAEQLAQYKKIWNYID